MPLGPKVLLIVEYHLKPVNGIVVLTERESLLCVLVQPREGQRLLALVDPPPLLRLELPELPRVLLVRLSQEGVGGDRVVEEPLDRVVEHVVVRVEEEVPAPAANLLVALFSPFIGCQLPRA